MRCIWIWKLSCCGTVSGDEDPRTSPVCSSPTTRWCVPNPWGTVQCLEKCVGHPSDQYRRVPPPAPCLEKEGLHIQRGDGKNSLTNLYTKEVFINLRVYGKISLTNHPINFSWILQMCSYLTSYFLPLISIISAVYVGKLLLTPCGNYLFLVQ